MERKVRKCIPLMAKTPDLPTSNGQFNGYVAIPYELWDRMKKHVDVEKMEQFGMSEYDLIPNDIYVPHGGFTFGEQMADFSLESYFIPMLDIRKVHTINYYVIGFDTCHHGDDGLTWNAKTVREEVFTLYQSILDYIKVRY